MTGDELCPLCAGKKVYTWFDINGTREEDAEWVTRTIPCPACSDGERQPYTMTLDGWEHTLDYIREVENVDPAIAQAWGEIIDIASRNVMVTVPIPQAFRDEIDAMIEDYRSEQEAARWM